MMRRRALLFAEDPGAANYCLGLPEALAARGIDSVLAAAGEAVRYLKDRDVTAQRLGDDAREALRGLRPNLVAAGTAENPHTLGLRLIAEARRIGTPSVGLVDSLANAAFRFRGPGRDPLGYAPDHLVVPDENTGTAYRDLGYPSENITVCGHPHYDRMVRRSAELAREGREAIRRTVLPRAPLDRPVVVFAAELSCGLDPGQYRKSAAYTLQGAGAATGRTEIVMEELLMASEKLARRPYLVLRLHPKNDVADFGPLAGEFDALSAGGDPSRLVYASDLVVGMTSMLLAEAALMGVPTLSVVPREAERAWLPSVVSDAIRCAWSREGVERALAGMLDGTPPPFSRPAIMLHAAERVAALLDARSAPGQAQPPEAGDEHA